MSTILNTYPIFESNQVLTSPHLNQLVSYLDQQNRLTRAKLIGMGVACGLELSYEPSPSPLTLTISKGTGVTSEGYLINLSECPTIKYRPYTLPSGVIYEPFVDPNTKVQDIDLNELLTVEAKPGAEDKSLSNPANFLDDKVVLLFVESFDKDLKSCLGKSCDELGKDRILTIRKLLISKADLAIVWARTNSGKLDAIYPEKYDLPTINLPRALFDPTASHSSDYEDFNKNYVNAFKDIYNELFDALSQSYDIYRPILLDSYNENNPFTRAPISNLKSTWRAFFENVSHPGEAYLGMQYMYDFIQDIILAYEEFKSTAFELLSECCPDMTRFPKHIMLGEAIPPPPDLCGQAEFRNEFVQPPIYNDQKHLLKKTVALHNRIVLMLESFDLNRINGLGTYAIKITPSKEKNTLLSQRSIPWYYDIDHVSTYTKLGKLEEYWNYEISEKCADPEDGLLLSYQNQSDDQSVVSNKLNTPLYYDLQSYSFYRIEGHIGKPYSTVETQITLLRDKFNLPFDLVTLRLDGNTNEDFNQLCQLHQLEADYHTCAEELQCHLNHIIDYWDDNFANRYGDAFANEFILLKAGFETHFDALVDALESLRNTLTDNLYQFTQNDFITHFIDKYQLVVTRANNLKQLLNSNLDDVIRSVKDKYPVELYVMLSQIYCEFFRILDAFILNCSHRRLAVVYHHYLYIIDYLEAHDKKLFSRYLEENRGIVHGAGVNPGGTFILLKNGIAVNGLSEDDVIADFILPYAYGCDSACTAVPTPDIDDLNIPNYTLPAYKRFHQRLYAYSRDLLRDIKSKTETPVLLIDVISELYFDKDQFDAKAIVLQLVQNGAIAEIDPINNPNGALPIDISGSADSVRTKNGYVAIAFVGEVQNFVYQPDKEHVGLDEFNYVFAFKEKEEAHSSMGKVHVYTSCCGEKPADVNTCYSLEILECWGEDSVTAILNGRKIDPANGNPYELLYGDLQETCGFALNELKELQESVVLRLVNCVLFSCIRYRFYEEQEMGMNLYIYQHYNSGPTNNKDLYTPEVLKCWGQNNVEDVLRGRGINISSNDPFQLLYNDLQKTAGFYVLELSKMSGAKVTQLLDCLQLDSDSGILGPLFSIMEYQRASSGPALKDPGFDATVLECWGEADVTKVLDLRKIDHQAGNIYELLHNSIKATRGFSFKEYNSLDKNSIAQLVRCVVARCTNDTNFSDNPMDILIAYQKQHCCTQPPEKTCYDVAILGCWGMTHVKEALETRKIDHSSMDNDQMINALLTSLVQTNGFSRNEIISSLPLKEELARRELLTCLSISHDGLKYDELETLIVDYQKVNCGFLEGTITPVTDCISTAVNGKVSTTTGLPIPGVAITVKGTTLGVVTDADGNYHLDLGGTQKTIIFSVPGYNPHEVEICNQTVVDLTLMDNVPHVEVDPQIIDMPDLLRILEDRSVSNTGSLNTAVKVQNAFKKSTGGLRLSESELSLLSKSSLGKLAESKGLIYNVNDTKSKLIDKILNV